MAAAVRARCCCRHLTQEHQIARSAAAAWLLLPLSGWELGCAGDYFVAAAVFAIVIAVPTAVAALQAERLAAQAHWPLRFLVVAVSAQ